MIIRKIDIARLDQSLPGHGSCTFSTPHCRCGWAWSCAVAAGNSNLAVPCISLHSSDNPCSSTPGWYLVRRRSTRSCSVLHYTDDLARLHHLVPHIRALMLSDHSLGPPGVAEVGGGLPPTLMAELAVRASLLLTVST